VNPTMNTWKYVLRLLLLDNRATEIFKTAKDLSNCRRLQNISVGARQQCNNRVTIV
jgi:hypothetical protein